MNLINIFYGNNKKEEYSNLIGIKSADRFKNTLHMLIYIFLTIIILSLIIKNSNLKSYTTNLEKNLVNISEKLKKMEIKIKDSYKNYNLLQLYIENRTQFYIKGRQKVMRMIGRKYNDSNIQTFQDKLNWLLIHESPELKTHIVDKILLREYSKKILGKNICVPLIKIYNNSNEINIDELPDKFVLKCNHGSGMNIICKNKTNFNINKAKKTLNGWMKINYGLIRNEYQYINVQKKIFAEIYLKDNLTDYKFYCFNGIPKLIKVQSRYQEKNLKMYHYYDLNWTITDIETKLFGNIKLSSVKFPRPKYLQLMIEYAKKFSKDYAFIRVDLYEFNDTVYLSELTFTPANALSPYRDKKQRIYLGNLLDISKIKLNNSF